MWSWGRITPVTASTSCWSAPSSWRQVSSAGIYSSKGRSTFTLVQIVTKFKDLIPKLSIHSLTLNMNMNNKCSECDYSSSCRSNLLRHSRSKHKGVRYSCSECDYSAAYKENLLRHSKAKHQGVKYSCSECAFSASYKGALLKHSKSIHEGAKYSCSECDFSSSY